MTTLPTRTQFNTTEDWAKALVEALEKKFNDPAGEELIAQPCALSHKINSVGSNIGQERAGTPGVMMYDPDLATVVLSDGTTWNAMTLAGDGGVYFLHDTTEFATTTIPEDACMVKTMGYYACGDLGHAQYHRVGSQPAHDAWFQDAASEYFELCEVVPNIRQTGAVGNGATDDYQAIMDCLGYVIATRINGGSVLIPAGAFLISDTIEINVHSIHLKGEGNLSSIIYTTGDFDGILVCPANPTSATGLIYGGSITDLAVRQGSINMTSGCMIRLYRTAEYYLTRLSIVGGFHGVRLEGTSETNVLTSCDIQSDPNNTSLATGSADLAIVRGRTGASANGSVQDPADSLWYAEPNSTFVSNCNFRSANDYGYQTAILMDAADGVEITNCHIGFGAFACITIAPAQSNLNVNHVWVSNCYIDPFPGRTSYGIYIYEPVSGASAINHNYNNCAVTGADFDAVYIDSESSDRLNFNNCTFAACGRHGINLQEAHEVTIVGCTFERLNQDTLNGNGVHMQPAGGKSVEDILISSCNFIRTFYRGIQSGADCQRLTIVNNYFDQAQNAPLFINHTPTNTDIIENNNALNYAALAGHQTSNYGRYTGTTDGSGEVTFAHGVFGGTPTSFLFSNRGTGTGWYPCIITALDATNVTLRFYDRDNLYGSGGLNTPLAGLDVSINWHASRK